MSQSSILWRMAEMGAIILMKTWWEGVRPKQKTPNWYVLFPPRSEDNDANRDERILHVGFL